MIGEQLSFDFEGHENGRNQRISQEVNPDEVGYWPYPSPCPWRDRCINYECFQETGGGCSGDYAICDRGQLASGRCMPEWRWELMSPHAQHYLKGVVLGDPKELRALARYERNLERKYEDV